MGQREVVVLEEKVNLEFMSSYHKTNHMFLVCPHANRIATHRSSCTFHMWFSVPTPRILHDKHNEEIMAHSITTPPYHRHNQSRSMHMQATLMPDENDMQAGTGIRSGRRQTDRQTDMNGRTEEDRRPHQVVMDTES